ncbi:MAG: hypothetical protein DBX52_02720 [Clostridiales bacterium]|nr:MAG: hypothetical protein DBX52_02720 [Clostridiales bacterium]
MKRIIAGLMLLFILLPACMAEGACVVDQANLLNEAERKNVSAAAEELEEKYQISVVILTISDYHAGETIQSVAEDYYDENGYLPDGILFAVSMKTREYYTCTTGTVIDDLNDRAIYLLNQAAVPDLADGNYYQAFCSYLRKADEFIAENLNDGSDALYPAAIPSEEKSKNILLTIGISLIFSCLIGFSVVMVMKSRMKTVKAADSAEMYIRPESFRLTENQDVFLYKTISRVRIQTDQNHHNPGGGTTIHTGSSGTSHGGGGGRF